MHPYRLALTAVAIAALLPATAGAAGTETEVAVPGPGTTLSVTAAAGQQNDISVDLSKSGYVVTDLRNLVKAGKGCVVVKRDTVTCTAAAPHVAEVSLGDRDDRFTGVGDLRMGVDDGAGDDVLTGGPGDESFVGGTGADTVSGGPGWDSVSYAGRAAPVSVRLNGVADDGESGEGDGIGGDVESIYGGGGDDVLKGTAAPQSLHGGDGDDTISGLDGSDWLYGDGDDDTLIGDGGDDRFETFQVPDGADAMYGGSGRDHAHYRRRVDAVTIDLDGVADDGAPGESDNVRADVEDVTGGRGPDILTGSNLTDNTLRGAGDDDILSGLGGDDLLAGYGGADTLLGGLDDDKLSATDNVAGNDSLDGDVGTDQCDSDAGDPETGCEL